MQAPKFGEIRSLRGHTAYLEWFHAQEPVIQAQEREKMLEYLHEYTLTRASMPRQVEKPSRRARRPRR